MWVWESSRVRWMWLMRSLPSRSAGAAGTAAPRILFLMGPGTGDRHTGKFLRSSLRVNPLKTDGPDVASSDHDLLRPRKLRGDSTRVGIRERHPPGGEPLPRVEEILMARFRVTITVDAEADALSDLADGVGEWLHVNRSGIPATAVNLDTGAHEQIEIEL